MQMDSDKVAVNSNKYVLITQHATLFRIYAQTTDFAGCRDKLRLLRHLQIVLFSNTNSCDELQSPVPVSIGAKKYSNGNLQCFLISAALIHNCSLTLQLQHFYYKGNNTTTHYCRRYDFEANCCMFVVVQLPCCISILPCSFWGLYNNLQQQFYNKESSEIQQV